MIEKKFVNIINWIIYDFSKSYYIVSESTAMLIMFVFFCNILLTDNSR